MFVVQITLILVYFNTLTITLTNKSILVMLSGSSLGALRELVAVAGILYPSPSSGVDIPSCNGGGLSFYIAIAHGIYLVAVG
jgi:hypothetical protein